ncbi:DUF2914 domain-containing protein [Gallaecimonas sp. GXIMD4217]|uniref:DUF2914 domain-containing protein n=1 Tax=Gallaecimonas sp. GXIMD4217 TaxID=3131927 RepID=UPI00311B0002
MVKREPVGSFDGDLVPAELEQICLFTEVLNQAGHRIHHLWFFEERLMADVELPVGADRWRTYSRKSLKPQWQGPWRVEIRDDQGRLLGQQRFVLGQVVSH